MNNNENERESEIMIGLHSIYEGIRSLEREIKKLVCTSEGLDELLKRSSLVKTEVLKLPVEILSPHAFQSLAKYEYEKRGLKYTRIPSQVFALTNPVAILSPDWLYKRISGGKAVKIFALDHVTDVHNGAAILRTAAFYGADCLLLPMKGSFGLGPAFIRIASGATEHVKIVKCAQLTRTLRKLMELDISVIGLSEHASGELKGEESSSVSESGICVVMGAEDRGLSNAVSRIIPKKVAILSKGKINSLNVSVAAAIAMERFF